MKPDPGQSLAGNEDMDENRHSAPLRLSRRNGNFQTLPYAPGIQDDSRYPLM